MKTHEALESLRLRFTSGNSVPVQSARITREEWETVEAALVTTMNLLARIEADFNTSIRQLKARNAAFGRILALPPLDESKYEDFPSII